MKKARKIVTGFIVLAVVLGLGYGSAGAQCVEKDVYNFSDFQLGLFQQCEVLHLKNSLTIDGSIANWAPFEADGKNVLVNAPGESASFTDATFVDNAVTLSNGSLGGTSINFKSLSSLIDGEVNCNNCEVKENLTSFGRLFWLGGSLNGLVTVSTPTMAQITGAKFNLGENESLILNYAEKALIFLSEFVFTGDSAINVSAPAEDKPQMVKMLTNKFIKESGSIDPAKVINAMEGSITAKLGSPEIVNAGIDSANFKIEIKTPFDNESWNDVSCPELAYERHINFEPYILSYTNGNLTSMEPVGVYGYVEEDGKKYLYVPRSTQIAGEPLDDKDIAILATCEGAGTSKFSNVTTLGELLPALPTPPEGPGEGEVTGPQVEPEAAGPAEEETAPGALGGCSLIR